MDEPAAPRKSPYAIPYDRFAGDAQPARAELVMEQPHESPPDVPSVSDSVDGD